MHLGNLDELGWWVIFIALAEIGLLLGGAVWALLQAAHRPAPVLLVMSITMVTILILMVYVITRTNEVLTLAGVPIGALVTAATGAFKVDATSTQESIDEVVRRVREAIISEAAAALTVSPVEPEQVSERPSSEVAEEEKVKKPLRLRRRRAASR